uniref:RILP-like protein 2 n=1 Tax=Varanus komodoensis TaxID=61221 RepID=A0A8D2LCK8_VARKO
MQAAPPPDEEEEEGAEEEGEEESEEEEGGGGGGGGGEGAFAKSAFQLTAEDVYDISYLLGRELHALGREPRAGLAARVARLQFRVVSVLEMLEALVSEHCVAAEALRLERDSLRREVDGLRAQGGRAGSAEVNLGPNQMIIDLTDANRPRFTLQELKEVLQERNQLKAQLLVTQEELQCYKRSAVVWDFSLCGKGSAKVDQATCCLKLEKCVYKKWFSLAVWLFPLEA